MTFPLYNECPNCGHKTKDHDKQGCFGDAGREEILNVFTLNCQCPLSGAEVKNAIAMQAAVEVALQRYGRADEPDSDFIIPGPVARL